MWRQRRTQRPIVSDGLSSTSGLPAVRAASTERVCCCCRHINAAADVLAQFRSVLGGSARSNPIRVADVLEVKLGAIGKALHDGLDFCDAVFVRTSADTKCAEAVLEARRKIVETEAKRLVLQR
eukprot:TRINITY_DN5504_c0_g1_i3.p2 TRINITY_DN5504_c0_g1~~TRINITY_DN5504_c0_g1_i3.p2  ORF type:complete len:124 (+),score=15.85 TRINITY_DN5504_c0_g1_i3:349-720(+)